MEKNPPQERHNNPTTQLWQYSSSFSNDAFHWSCSIKDIAVSKSKDVDQFIEALWATHDKSSGFPEVPDIIDFFSRDMETRVQTYACGDVNRRFGKSAEEDSDFMKSVRRMFKLINALSEFNNVDSLLNQTTVALHRAALFLEEEFRTLLDDSRNNNNNNQNSDPPEISSPSFYKFSSFKFKNQPDQAADRCLIRWETDSGDHYPVHSPGTVAKMREIASTMIAVGYEVECSQAYFLCRRNAMRNYMMKMEYDVVLNMDNLARMPWQLLEAEISRWINAVKAWSEVIFPEEKKLGESVFSDSPAVHRQLLGNHVRFMAIQFVDFAEATALAKRSAEKLFKYLDIYELLKDQMISAIRDEPCSDELIPEVSAAADHVGQYVMQIFRHLEDSIQNDAARTPVPGGAVHPLTRYVMNYLKYAFAYKDTLEGIFRKHSDNLPLPVPNSNPSSQELETIETDSPNYDTAVNITPFSIQVEAVMDRLDTNLERKSNLYKDRSLRYIFLMNNGRYNLQKVKGSPEIREAIGDNWCRRKSTVVRRYHKTYQREAWSRVLQCLSHEGIVGMGGKVNKSLLKERLKEFTTTFEEVQRTQSGWVVSDEQLQSELRISISAVVIPAYRSFVGRFKNRFENARQVSKYVKYQPEDIEAMIEGLFEGTHGSLSKRRL